MPLAMTRAEALTSLPSDAAASVCARLVCLGMPQLWPARRAPNRSQGHPTDHRRRQSRLTGIHGCSQHEGSVRELTPQVWS